MRMLVEQNVSIPMRDGTILQADLYRPLDGGPRPALIARTPYSKAAWPHTAPVDTFSLLGAGYALIVQDTRGRYTSAGTFEPFVDERDDGADTVAWVAQQPWCTGRVALFGGSYPGAAALLGATARPQALHAVAAMMTAANPYHFWTYNGGAFELGFTLLWTLNALASGEASRRGDRDAISRLEDAVARLDQLYADPAAARQLLQSLAPYWAAWQTHPAYDDYWWARSADEPALEIAAPVLLTAGWFDIFLRGTLDAYAQLRRQADAGRGPAPRLIVGPWTHAVHSGVYPSRDFGPRAAMTALNITAEYTGWFDRWLKGVQPAVEALPVRIFVMGRNVWCDEANWPPPDVRHSRFYLASTGHANTAHGDGRLTRAPEPALVPDAFVYDPGAAVPTAGGGVLLRGAEVGRLAGPGDQRQVESRQDVLCYTGLPLEASLEVVGPGQLHLFVSSNAADTDFTAKVVDVAQDGSVALVCDGIIRCRYRLSTDAPAWLEPDVVYELAIDLAATAYQFAPGHRLRLEVSSSNFPRFDANPNTGPDSGAPPRVALNRVYHDERYPSALVLPLRPAH